MTKPKRKRIKIGDVIEIATPKGLAYAQFSHTHGKLGPLLRILPGLFEIRPESLTNLVGEPERFFVHFPLQAAVTRGIVEIVGNEALPERLHGYPLMRAYTWRDQSTGRGQNWSLSAG